MKTFTFDCESEQAFALAQLLKRLTYSDIREKAVDDDECEVMKAAIYELSKALAEQGINPR